jgi:hypothetical protein
MVKFKRGYDKLDSFTGFGVITDISLDNVTIYWQQASTYKNYSVASAVLSFEIIENT